MDSLSKATLFSVNYIVDGLDAIPAAKSPVKQAGICAAVGVSVANVAQSFGCTFRRVGHGRCEAIHVVSSVTVVTEQKLVLK